MNDESFVTTKNIRFQQKQLDKYKCSSFSDFSKFVRSAVDAYDVSFEELKRLAKVEAYEECITKMSVEREFVLHASQIGSDELHKAKITSQTTPNTTSFVAQTSQITPNNGDFVAQTEEAKNPVAQNTSQNDEKTPHFVAQIEENPYYEKLKPYFSLLSKQLNVMKEVPDDTKKMISTNTEIPVKKIGSFIYEFKDKLMEEPYEIPDESSKQVEKTYNRVAKEFL